MRRLWTEPEVTFQGRYFQVQSVRLGYVPYNSRVSRSGWPGVRIMRSGGCYAWAMAGCRFRPRPRPSRRIGSVFKSSGKRWVETPTTYIAVCIPRSTSTPMYPGGT